MAQQKTLVSLDIGSSKIRTIVGITQEKKNLINIIGVGISPSNGIRKGMVTDIDEAVSNITASLEDAERMSGEPIHRVFVGFSGPHIETYDSRGVIAINGPNAEITEDDVDRVLDAARAVSLPANREILRIIPKSFSIDSQHGIKYPVGMTGIRLEVEAHIIAGQKASIKNLEKCLYETGVDIEEIIPSNLACAETVLDKKQKELGVVLIEVGACSTNVALFEEGTVVSSAVIPVGGEHVTNDLAIGLRSSIETAEKIKIEYGTCLPGDVSDREEIDLSKISKSDSHSVNKKQVAQIIEARYHEIFMMVRDELAKVGRDGQLPAGAILCGGAVKMPGVIDLARESLQLPVQLGFPNDIEGIVDRVDDPSFAHSIGLLHFGNRYGGSRSLLDFDFRKMFGSLSDFFKRLLP
ncbi:cell division protein FtsA [Candidatus Gracilibacteria bacterium]|nr:cell division protein FtsA [Candidatus Gracilibacteria bacterium]MCF7819506.1 cell division protein FtsA [Candidatus Gracilibacteria bacterium]